MPKIDENPDPIELNISDEKLGFLILKAREFEVKVEPVDPDPGSNTTDDDDRAVLEDQVEDRTEAELRDALHALNEDETIDVIALLWVGRGDFGREDWAEARRLAAERHRHNSTGYLLGTPTLAGRVRGRCRSGRPFHRRYRGPASLICAERRRSGLGPAAMLGFGTISQTL